MTDEFPEINNYIFIIITSEPSKTCHVAILQLENSDIDPLCMSKGSTYSLYITIQA